MIDVERLGEMFGALSNPNRLTLFLRLVDCCGQGEQCSTDAGMGACVGDLANGLGLAPSTVSHHLKELRRTGLISMKRRGRKIECTVNVGALKELSSIIDASRHQQFNDVSVDC